MAAGDRAAAGEADRRGGVSWEMTRQRGCRIPELRSVGDSAPDVVHHVCSINMTAVVPGSSASNTWASSAESLA